MAETKKKDDVNKLSFEESIKRLRQIVESIEQGDIALQDSLDQYEQGMALIKHCRGILQQAEKRIDKISKADAVLDDKTEEATPEAEDEVLF
jgi:exodeoxyribonuclease VII small subunit